MSIEIALVTLLRQHAGAGRRVTPSTETVKVYEDLPRIIYSMIALDRIYSDDGNVGIVEVTYQLDIFSAKVTEAHEIADAIRVDIDGLRGEVAGVPILRIYFGGERFGAGDSAEGANNRVSRYSMDVTIIYRERVS